mgnify:CR=1 FL=1
MFLSLLASKWGPRGLQNRSKKQHNFIPQNYNQTWVTKKKRRDVKIVFDNGSLVKLKLTPNEIEHPRIKYIGINNHSDPLSSFLNILMAMPGAVMKVYQILPVVELADLEAIDGWQCQVKIQPSTQFALVNV